MASVSIESSQTPRRRARLLEDGPAEYWSETRAPTVGQWRALAHAAAVVLGLPAPTTRLEATTLLVRLRMAEGELPAPPTPPEAF